MVGIATNPPGDANENNWLASRRPAVSRLCLESHTVTTDLPDADRVYRNYLATCRRLGINPVPRERAEGLIAEWSAEIVAGRSVPPISH